MNTCQLGIKHTVEQYVEKKSYLKFNGSNFIEVVTSFTKKVFPENFFVVAESVANKLNKNINSNINVGNVFYNGTKNNKRGVIIAPTTKQLNLLNARDAEERELAIQEWESEEHQRELAERLIELEAGNNLYFQRSTQVREGYGEDPIFYDTSTVENLLKNKATNKVSETYSDIPLQKQKDKLLRVGAASSVEDSIGMNTLIADKNGNLYIVYEITNAEEVLRGEALLDYYEDGINPSDISAYTLSPVYIKKNKNGQFIIKDEENGDPVFGLTSDKLYTRGYSIVGEYNRYQKETKDDDLSFQLPKLKQSTASPELLNKIKQILKNKGIRIENLVEYAKKTGLNIGGINAVADTIRNIIAIAHGKEDVALTEEFVHIATAAIEQSSPKLIEEMMSKINRFKIYNVVLNLYKNDKNYQLANGKPDIRKIKKEAVDKLIAEVIINNSENKTEFPELLEEENIILVERWWNSIKDFFKGMYKASNLNIFEEAASKVMEGEFSEVKEEIAALFEQNSELANIGTPQQYSKYLSSIGVTNIAYHHSDEDLFEFTSSSERYFQKELKKKGKYISKLDDIVFLVKKPLSEEFMSKRKFVGTWGLKTPRILQFNAGEKIGEGVHPGIDEGIFSAIRGNYDAVDFGRIRDNRTWSEVIAITNPNNAIKLGSKQDIQGFKEFVRNNESATNQGVFFQKENVNLNNVYNDIVEKSKNLVLFPEEDGKKRHYEYNGEEVATSVTEKVKKLSKPLDRTPEQKRLDNQKAAWGTEGHNYIANELIVNFIDENGYKRETPLNNKINSPLSEKQMEVLRAFCVELMSTYNVPGTRFIIEGGIVNPKVKGMIAGTTDFVALVPNDSKEGFQMDILDWKFIDNIAEKKGDIHHKKAEQWNAQMNEYINIYTQAYGIKPQQIKKSRMIPFISTYEYGILGDKTSDLNLSSIQVGSLTKPDDTKLYTLAVPTLTEDTGNPKVNQFIRALNSHWKKLYDRHISEEKREAKIDELNRIRRAIRLLHVKMNFEPITGLIKTFLTNIDKSLLEFVGVDFSNLSKEDLSAKLKLLVEYKESAEKFLGVDEIYLSTLDEENATDEELALLKRLRQYVGATKLRMDKILDIQKQVALQLGLKEGIVTEETKESLLSPELELGNMAKLFMERAMLPSKIINLAAKVWKVSKEVVNRNIVKQIDQFSKLLSPVEGEASNKGVSAFSLIGEIRKGKNGEETLKLKRKVDVNFYKEINTALEKKDKAVLIQNIDLAKYNELAQKTINQKIQDIENEEYSTNEEENTKLRDMNIKFVKDRFDINRSSFNGFSDNSFQYLLKQCLKVDEHLSEDYKNMSDSAKALWQFFYDLNVRGKKSGYIDKEGMSFFALVEGNASEKLGAASNVFGELIDIAKDAYTVKINEELNYSKIDEETGEVKRNIPKFYTRTDKTVRQLSTDLNKVGTAWIQALLEYENRVNMESVLQTLVEVEKSKGSLMLDSKNNVIMEAGQAKVNENVNENVDVLKAFLDNSIYNIMESETSWGNVSIKEIAGKLQKDEEAKEKVVLSTKKVVGTMDTLVRVLGTGLKASLATANWVGHQFQSFITAGNFYTTSEYQKNNLKYTTGVGLSTEEKALLHLIIPLNEDVAMEKRRQIAKKQSLKKWLETWSFAELMLSPTSFLERKLQHVNAMSFNENSMVVDGKIVNIRQYVNKQAQSRYAKDENGNFILSSSERKAEERKIEEKIKELKETSSLVKIVKVENDEITIPGVTDEEIARYRLKIVDYGRKLSGQMSREDRAGFRQDSIIRSFMMFRTWVPPLVLQRTGRIRKNYETDEWEYGRTRVFLKVWSSLANYNILQMYDVIKGTDKGLAILDEMFEDKRREHLLKTGKELEITQEEFYDLVRKKLSEQMKELGVLFSVLGVVLLAKAAQPPEDATDAEKNRYKWWARVVNKISDEITFYYNPATFESITKGSIMPALGILTKAGQFISALGKETEGYILDDEKMMKEAHPLKYGLNMIPGAYQFQTGVLPYVWPDWAKDLDIRVTTQSRKQ